MTDPQDTVSVAQDELRDREVDVRGPVHDDLPIEANEADVLEQLQDLPDLDEDDYRG
jgi:hypothetical protein